MVYIEYNKLGCFPSIQGVDRMGVEMYRYNHHYGILFQIRGYKADENGEGDIVGIKKVMKWNIQHDLDLPGGLNPP